MSTGTFSKLALAILLGRVTSDLGCHGLVLESLSNGSFGAYSHGLSLAEGAA